MNKWRIQMSKSLNWEIVRKRYAKRMEKLANKIATELRELGNDIIGPYIMYYEDWNMVALPSGEKVLENGVDITIKLFDSSDYDEKVGFSFGIDVVECGCRILGGFHPYNYTEKCWCYTFPSLQERWKLIEKGTHGKDIDALFPWRIKPCEAIMKLFPPPNR